MSININVNYKGCLIDSNVVYKMTRGRFLYARDIPININTMEENTCININVDVKSSLPTLM
jgi:hypothetical protein